MLTYVSLCSYFDGLCCARLAQTAQSRRKRLGRQEYVGDARRCLVDALCCRLCVVAVCSVAWCVVACVHVRSCRVSLQAGMTAGKRTSKNYSHACILDKLQSETKYGPFLIDICAFVLRLATSFQ